MIPLCSFTDFTAIVHESLLDLKGVVQYKWHMENLEIKRDLPWLVEV